MAGGVPDRRTDRAVGIYVRTRLLDSPAFVALGERARQGRAPFARALGTAKRGRFMLMVWFGAQTIGGWWVDTSSIHVHCGR